MASGDGGGSALHMAKCEKMCGWGAACTAALAILVAASVMAPQFFAPVGVSPAAAVICEGWVADYFPPFPGAITVTQPDGTHVSGKLASKETGGGIITPEGKRLFAGAGGVWAEDKANAAKGRQLERWMSADGTDMRPSVWRESGERQFPSGVIGTKKYPVLLMQFNDRHFSAEHTKEFYSEMMFGNYSLGSAREFFYENSYGKFNFTGEVFGPFEVAKPMSYYGALDDAGAMMSDLLPVVDADVDFSRFQTSPGHVDMIIIIHAGLDQAFTGIPDDIWSNANPQWAATADSVQLAAPNTCPEDTGIGVITHEAGHSIGEPDYYDYSGKSEGTGQWDQMGSGAWHGDPPRTNPAHFNPLSKSNYGWATATKVAATQKDISIRPSEAFPDIVSVSIPSTQQEFLVEYRNRTVCKFDRYLGASGAVIWHYNPAASDNSHPPDFRLDVEEFGYRLGLQDIEQAYNRQDPTDVWKNDTTGIGPATSPSTAVAGSSAQSDWLLCDFSAAQEQMSFSVYKLSAYADLSVEKPMAGTANPAYAGQPANLSVKVYNNGAMPAANVRVRVFEGAQPLGLQIGGDIVIPSIPAYGTYDCSVAWTPQKEGFPEITAVVDPDGEFPEICTENNVQSSEFLTYYPSVPRVFGKPAPILVIDDDSGMETQAWVEETLQELRYPFVTSSQTIPPQGTAGAELIVWLTGADQGSGAFNAADVDAIRAHLDAGGRAWLPSNRGAAMLSSASANQIFLRDYFGVEDVNRNMTTSFLMAGTGDEIGGSQVYAIHPTYPVPFSLPLSLGASAIGTASASFNCSLSNYSAIKVAGDATHKNFRTAAFNFDLDQLASKQDAANITQRVLDWMGISEVDLDKATYWVGPDRHVRVHVRDSDANANPGAAETVTVTVASTSDPLGVPLTLTEDSEDSGDFAGELNISSQSLPASLKAVKGDTINATYADASSGKVRWALASVDALEFASFNVAMATGWNLLSIPLAANDTSIEGIMAALSAPGSVEAVLCYDPSNPAQPWKSYRPGAPAESNTISTVGRGMGIWVKSTTGENYFSVSGYRQETLIPMKKGWNLIGYPSLNATRTASEVLGALPWEHIQTGGGLGKYGLREVGESELLKPGAGYWVYVSRDCTLKVGA